MEKVTKQEITELVDWELKQTEERQKLFGVGSWSLLVGLAGTIWATASLPVLGTASPARVAIAFVLLESTLVALSAVWTVATRLTIRAKRLPLSGAIATQVSANYV